ncbi:MAG: response regulator transcription factor [Desulfitobacteriaceae bacterium]|nr:response regulator transcription factor [Desulfitobacteriaceae bacterium]MDI6913740.1 response regulator transcription factor [Desulfitobacteriaceae bacterium]
MPSIKVLLIDDHTLFRAGVKMLLQNEPDMVVVGETSDGKLALELCLQVQPDVVILDLSMPEMDGLSVARTLRQELPTIRILVVSQYDNKEYVLRATKLGVSGYLLKSAAADELVAAIRAVCSGHKYLDATVTQVLMEAWQEGKTAESLSDREVEILVLTAQGKTIKEIAEVLHISPKTVEFHRAKIQEKTGAHGRVELTRYAISHKLIDP